MIPWKIVHGYMIGFVVASLIATLLTSSRFLAAVTFGLGLGWINLSSLVFLGKSVSQGNKMKRWYFPLWFVKWILLGSLLYAALKTNLSPIGLILGFIISLTILAVVSFGSIRNVLHSRSS